MELYYKFLQQSIDSSFSHVQYEAWEVVDLYNALLHNLIAKKS